MTKLIDLFPTTECSRCGGTGHYSYNSMTGSRCFKCNGVTQQWANKKVEAIVAEYRAAVKLLRECSAQDVEAGQFVKVSDGRISYYGSGTWAEVAAVDVSDEASRWSVSNDVKTETAWFTTITLVDGSTHKLNGCELVRTKSPGVDSASYVERANAAVKPALRKSVTTA